MTNWTPLPVEDHPYLEDDPYPLLRESLAPELRRLPAEDIEHLFEQVGLSAEEMEEGIWGSIGNAFRTAGRAVARAAPTLLPVAGTALGTVVGGPVGAAVGGSLGRLAGGAIGAATAPRRRPAPGPQRPGRRPAPAARPSGASPAAAQLLQVLNRPEVLRALQSMALGRSGTSNVTVGSTPVPVGAIANLIGTLANSASSEHHVLVAGEEGGVPVYLLDADGEAVVDLASAEERAQRLLELMDQALLADAAEIAYADYAMLDEEDDYEEDDLDEEEDDLDEEDLWDLLDALEEEPWEASFGLDDDDEGDFADLGEDDELMGYGTRYG